MSKDELVKEVNYLAKRIEEEEVARKEEERKIAELENWLNCLRV